MAAPRIRKLVTAQGAFDSVLLQGHNGHPIPWDVVLKKLAELFRFLASAFPALVAGIQEWATALEQPWPCGRRRPRGPNGEEVYGRDGPVVRYGGRGGGGYRGGIFSMHPNKPIVC
ncbi:hypothetical protein CFC21_026409 [Triticum aestivum]|uniref:Uncharacterized protein n=2 Tax=Triticum aestivum TaxID=4565 RepID=A0A9R1JCA7_WHEAT|nr:hypothetical protein CFC21_026409 [Triticum aestivum]